MKTRKPDEPVMCLQCGVPMVMTPNGHWACPTTIEAKRMLELAITNPVDRAALAGAAVQPTGVDFLFRWMETKNPLLGDVTPLWMMEHGKGEKLAKFIRQSWEDSRAADPQEPPP